jgi:DNA (cytosine-5)-methyltransferase 1
MSDNTEKEWQRTASATLKAELVRAGIGYEELIKRLAKIGIEETYKSVSSKINRGSFTFAFFAQCMKAIGVNEIRLH